jgi:HPt (histidine-containing phosphotransfer) domain-containing protein
LADIGEASPIASAGTSAARQANVASVDESALATLRQIMSDAEVREFLEIFLAETRQRVAAIASALAKGDAAPAGDNAHTLVGIAGHVGATRFGQLARELEAACRSGDLVTASALSSDLGAAADTTLATVADWLRQLRVS